MTLPGTLIPESNKRKQTETSSQPRPPAGSASERLALLEAREAKALEQRTAILNDQPLNDPPVLQRDNEQRDSSKDNEDQATYDHFQLTGDMDEIDPNNDAQEIHPPGLRSAYFKSVTYRERTLREEANWRKIIPELFNAFITCSFKTRQWGDEEAWNRDLNFACKCPTWKISQAEIDVVDLTSRKKITLERCACTTDVVSLVRRGYIGATPLHPQIAFSIRLVGFHHIVWKYCTVRLAPFVEAINKYLDAGSPLFLVLGTEQTRDYRKGFSAAVNVYREMIRLEDKLASRALCLSPTEKLASNCPPCFGPKVPGKRPDEPDHVICLDGNFQHRRHEAASAKWRGESGTLPSLFVEPNLIKIWEKRMEGPPRRNHQADKQDEVIVGFCDLHCLFLIYVLNFSLCRIRAAISTLLQTTSEVAILGVAFTRLV
ncbi:hypothetical protein DFH28DRAFT_888009 [Melampsora americana]|nr:hypothetical protein DFH28DRAFT_888009 [Melampsora americana]